MRYAALKFLGALVAGILIGYWFAPPLIVIVILIIAGLAVMKWTKGYSIFLSIFCLSVLNINSHQPVNFNPLYNHFARFEGVVDEEPQTSGYLPRYIVSLKKIWIGGKEIPIKGKVFVQHPQILDYGDLISFDGELKPLDYPKNRNLFDFNVFYGRQGIIGTAKTENLTLIAKHKGNIFIQSIILPLRRYFFKTFDRYLPGEEGALLAGLILGEKSEISPATRKAFALTGVMHILAVSGLNVAILASVLFLFFKVIRLKTSIALGLLALILILYVTITKFSPSVVRAALMSFAAFLGLFLERRSDTLNSVFVAAIAILAFSPFALLESSFQLSFAATLGLILFYEKINLLFDRFHLPAIIQKSLIAPLSVSAAAQLGATPLLLYSFFRLPLLSLFANLAVVPLVGLATPLGFLIPLFSLINSTVANLFAQATRLVLAIILKITAFIGGLSFASLVTGKPSILLVLFIYGLILLVFHLTKPWTKRAFAYSLLVGVNVFIFTGIFQPKRLELSVLDLSRGNAAFVRFPNGRNLLWNTGSGSTIVPDFLRSRGISTVDFVALPTVKDYKKTDNLEDLKIKNLLTPTFDSLKIKTTTRLVVENGLELQGLADRVRIFNLNRSLTMRINYQGISILFLDEFKPLADSVTVLCLARDNGLQSNSPLRFAYLVIAQDESIPAETVAALHQAGVKDVYTLTGGGLTILTDGKRISIKH
jgi:competence protein ComEC